MPRVATAVTVGGAVGGLLTDGLYGLAVLSGWQAAERLTALIGGAASVLLLAVVGAVVGRVGPRVRPEPARPGARPRGWPRRVRRDIALALSNWRTLVRGELAATAR